MLLPNFRRRRQKLEPVTFVPVSKVFKAQVTVQAKLDLNGWANVEKRLKWSVGKGELFYMDEDKAREFAVKGFVRVIEGDVKPVSDDEAAEIKSTSTTITLGAG